MAAFRSARLAALLWLGASGPLHGAGAVTLSIVSPQDGLEVAPGADVEWTIGAVVSPGGSLGLALVMVDLVQDDSNPRKLDLPPASGVPPGMELFSRPLGISNPGEDGRPTGYAGVQRGAPGARNLVQIGGAQNTLGAAGGSLGANVAVAAGIGQAAPAMVAGGRLPAPATPGKYRLRLEEARASTLDAVAAPPSLSRVSAAAVSLAPAEISFTVKDGSAPCAGACFIRGDCDGDGSATGAVTDVIFLLSYNFLGGEEPPCLSACDVDGDGQVQGSVTDVIYLLQFNFLGGSVPPTPFPSCGAGRASDAGLGCARSPEACR